MCIALHFIVLPQWCTLQIPIAYSIAHCRQSCCYIHLCFLLDLLRYRRKCLKLLLLCELSSVACEVHFPEAKEAAEMPRNMGSTKSTGILYHMCGLNKLADFEHFESYYKGSHWIVMTGFFLQLAPQFSNLCMVSLHLQHSCQLYTDET